MKNLNIVITVHTGFSFLTKLLSDKGREVVVINRDNNIHNTFHYSGVIKKIKLIDADNYSLLRIKELLHKPISVVCCIDQRSRSGKFTDINYNLIKFAQTYQTPLYIYKDLIHSDATISAHIIKASLNKPLKYVLESFIDFINMNQLIKRKFTLLK